MIYLGLWGQVEGHGEGLPVGEVQGEGGFVFLHGIIQRLLGAIGVEDGQSHPLQVFSGEGELNLASGLGELAADFKSGGEEEFAVFQGAQA